MTADKVSELHGPRLAEVLGPNYREHPSFPYVVKEIAAGTRTLANILLDVGERVSEKRIPRRLGW